MSGRQRTVTFVYVFHRVNTLAVSHRLFIAQAQIRSQGSPREWGTLITKHGGRMI